MSTLDDLGRGEVHEIAQDDSRATYAHRLTKADGVIDWTLPAERLHNVIRGLHPWPHAYTHLEGRRLIVLKTRVEPMPATATPGTILGVSHDAIQVATGDAGRIAIEELQPEGRRPMSVREFLAGHRIAPGDRFSGP